MSEAISGSVKAGTGSTVSAGNLATANPASTPKARRPTT
jgi:hypothetical protein